MAYGWRWTGAPHIDLLRSAKRNALATLTLVLVAFAVVRAPGRRTPLTSRAGW